MGTQYYLHLGERTSNGAGKPLTFTWAVERDKPLVSTLRIVNPFTASDEESHIVEATILAMATVEDEHGNRMSFHEFYDLIRHDISDERFA